MKLRFLLLAGIALPLIAEPALALPQDGLIVVAQAQTPPDKDKNKDKDKDKKKLTPPPQHKPPPAAQKLQQPQSQPAQTRRPPTTQQPPAAHTRSPNTPPKPTSSQTQTQTQTPTQKPTQKPSAHKPQNLPSTQTSQPTTTPQTTPQTTPIDRRRLRPNQPANGTPPLQAKPNQAPAKLAPNQATPSLQTTPAQTQQPASSTAQPRPHRPDRNNPMATQPAPVMNASPTTQPQKLPPAPKTPAAVLHHRPPADTPAAVAGTGQRIQDLRNQRREIKVGTQTVIQEPGRTIVRDGNRTFIRHNEVSRFQVNARDIRTERRGNETMTVVVRPDGSRIITVTGDDGRLLRRLRRDPRGREIVIIDNSFRPRPGPRGPGFFLDIPPPRVMIPRERYIVDAGGASPALIYEALAAPPIERIERAYSLDEIRFNQNLRERMRRVDIDTVTFDTGSWEVTPDQMPRLQVIADAIARAVQANPSEVFLVEGHTDAVGADIDNLSLSDRRAEAVALALSSQFNVPPENLTTQGYGEQYLKIPTEGPERQNRRVTVRRITPLLTGNNQSPPSAPAPAPQQMMPDQGPPDQLPPDQGPPDQGPPDDQPPPR